MLYLLKKLKHIDSYGESYLSMFYLKFYCPWKLCPLLPILYGRNKSVQNTWSCHKLHRFIDFPTPSANMNFFFFIRVCYGTVSLFISTFLKKISFFIYVNFTVYFQYLSVDFFYFTRSLFLTVHCRYNPYCINLRRIFSRSVGFFWKKCQLNMSVISSRINSFVYPCNLLPTHKMH